jgi:heat shock protein HtpX
MWWGGMDDDNKESRNPLVMVLFILALIITPIAATLIQLAVSRRREYLADASGALLTRNPDELADALEKIADDRHIMQHATASTAHLFIENPLKKGRAGSFITNLLSTHPPIEDRIRILREM